MEREEQKTLNRKENYENSDITFCNRIDNHPTYFNGKSRTSTTKKQRIAHGPVPTLKQKALLTAFSMANKVTILENLAKLSLGFEREIAAIILFTNTILSGDDKAALLRQFAHVAHTQKNVSDEALFTYLANLVDKTKDYVIKQREKNPWNSNAIIGEKRTKSPFSLSFISTYSWLTQAIIDKQPIVVEFLLAHGANPNALTTQENIAITPLFIAAHVGDATIVKILLEKGALATTSGILFQQPLYAALKNGNFKSAALIFAAIQNKEQYINTQFREGTFLEYFRKSGMKNIVKWLQKHGAK